MEDTIFIQIPSYRDPELIPTIEDAISKARYPGKLSFGICWQHHDKDEWDNIDKYKNDSRFSIIDVPWNESRGLCWARSRIQKLYQGQDYTLQIDSHHRFAPDWDIRFIEMLRKCESDNPILTSYAGMYSPITNKLVNRDPYKMVGKRFTPSGTILFFPEVIQGWQDLNQPIPGRFVSGHFYFTRGKHCNEYKYDPNLYFAGDEISLSIRSFTLGYDIFHPHELLIWHEYTREGRVKHWDDFTNKNQDKIDEKFHEMDIVSKKRLRKMLREEENDADISGFDLGSVRTHEEYELYAGIDFRNRVLHPDTINGTTPPTVSADDNSWRSRKTKAHRIHAKWKKAQIPTDSDFIFIGIESNTNELLHRSDLTDAKYIKGDLTEIDVRFDSTEEPATVTVWPHKNGKWLDKVVTPI